MKDDIKKMRSKEFTEYMFRTSLFSMRNGLFATLYLFILFALLNMWFFPQQVEQRFFMRFGFIMPFIILSLVVLYFRAFWSRIELYLTIINVFVALAVFYVGINSGYDTPGYSYYFVWVMLVFMGTAAFYRIRYINFVGVSILLITAFILANVFNGALKADPFAFANRLFFVTAMASIGFFISWNIYELNRYNFIHQKALEKNYNDLLKEIRERNQMEKSLDTSQQQYLTILDTIPDSIFVIDRDMQIVMANAQILRINKMFGLETNVIGRKFYEVYPFLPEGTLKETAEVFTSGQLFLSTQHTELGGQKFITETRKIPMTKDNIVEQVMLIIRDVTREKSYEELKLRNAEQKELLLREIHHRVKNNLAIVISMLSLQSRSNPDPMLTGIIQDIELRIRSMALIHEHLYRSENLDRIPLADYLKSLSAVIASTFQQKNITFNSELETMDSDIEAALPVGLITNELLTNAFKYAFPAGRTGTITLRLRQLKDEQVELTITDDGIGLPEHFSFEEQSTLGMFMVRLLIEQLYGKLEIVNKAGTCFRITFSHKLI
jgi:PAS domain S-box-containing protein